MLAGDDRHAFAELVRRHQSSVRTLLRRLARNDHGLADDLAQDTFIQVHRNLRQFRGDAKFATWIYRIAYAASKAKPLAKDVLPCQEYVLRAGLTQAHAALI